MRLLNVIIRKIPYLLLLLVPIIIFDQSLLKILQDLTMNLVVFVMIGEYLPLHGEFNLKEYIKSPAFWYIAGIFLLGLTVSLKYSTIMSHFVPSNMLPLYIIYLGLFMILLEKSRYDIIP